jgi:quinol monooxygenase YgiN
VHAIVRILVGGSAIKFRSICFVILLVAVLMVNGTANAQADKSTSAAQNSIPPKDVDASLPLVIVVHVDAMPPFTAQALEQLKSYREDTLKERGAERVDILQQVGRPNHFSIVEQWANQKAFDDHVSAPHTLKFRSNLQSMLGAPFDERPHHFIGQTLP